MNVEQMSPQEALRQQKAIEQINASWNKEFQKVRDDIALRRWCVEQANSQHATMSATQILQFITEPLSVQSMNAVSPGGG